MSNDSRSPWPPSFRDLDAVLDAVISRASTSIKCERGDEVVLSPCPITECRGDKFSINRVTGLWNCPKCGEKGNAWQLVERLGVGPVASASYAARPARAAPSEPRLSQEALDSDWAAAQAALPTSPDALAFLERRRITLETARAFRLGARAEGGHTSIGFPYFRANGRVAFVKWRRIDTKEFLRLPAKARMPLPEVTPLFNGWRLDPSAPVFLTEGEFDTMALWQAGVQNVASIANGAGGFNPSWLPQLATSPAVYCAFDQDEDGEKAAVELRRRLGRERVLRLLFSDHKDANDALMEGWGAEAFAEAVRQARREPPEILKGVRDLARERVAEALGGARPQAIETGWPDFDRTQRGLRPGELTVLTAHTGEGKTVWSLDLALRLAERGIPVTYVSLEQRPGDTVDQILGMLRLCAFDDIPPEQLEAAVAAVPECLYLAIEPQNDRLGKVLDAVRYSVVVYGVRVVVVDHLDFLIDPAAGESRYAAASAAVKALHAAARDLALHLILICQPTSDSGRAPGARRREIRLEDIAETRLARQLASNGFLWSSEKEKRLGHLYVAKARYGPAQEGITIEFRFDGFRFHDTGIRTGRVQVP